jgi:hypothetical protein
MAVAQRGVAVAAWQWVRSTRGEAAVRMVPVSASDDGYERQYARVYLGECRYLQRRLRSNSKKKKKKKQKKKTKNSIPNDWKQAIVEM